MWTPYPRFSFSMTKVHFLPLGFQSRNLIFLTIPAKQLRNSVNFSFNDIVVMGQPWLHRLPPAVWTWHWRLLWEHPMWLRLVKAFTYIHASPFFLSHAVPIKSFRLFFSFSNWVLLMSLANLGVEGRWTTWRCTMKKLADVSYTVHNTCFSSFSQYFYP